MRRRGQTPRNDFYAGRVRHFVVRISRRVLIVQEETGSFRTLTHCGIPFWRYQRASRAVRSMEEAEPRQWVVFSD